MKKILKVPVVVLCLLMAFGGATGTVAQTEPKPLKDEYRFVMIPILAQAWFDIVKESAEQTAAELGAQLGTRIVIDYQAPAQADLVEQNTLLERAIATNPDGITIDANDVDASMPILKDAQDRGIPLVLFVSTAPEGSGITYVSNDFYEQGTILANELLKRINNAGKVAIIHGVPTNSAHADRYQAINDVFANYPDVQIVETAFDYDDMQTAQTEASRILSAHPDLDAFAVVDAAGPVGVGLALQEAGRVGDVVYVGIDDVPQLQELMREGVLDLSIATQPRMIGRWIVIALMMQNLGFATPQWLDTGIGYLTPDMVKDGNIEGF
jgi:ribose transport system substrate-binding protein